MMVVPRARAAVVRTFRSRAVIAVVLGSAFAWGTVCAPALAAVGTPVPGNSAATSSARATFDCTSYQKLLDEFLVVTSPPGEPLETRFDYIALERLQDRATRFATIRQDLLDVEPSRMKDTERLAWAINAYNFMVIQAITENVFEPFHIGQKGEKKFIYRNRHTTVQTMSINGEKFFEATVVQIEGRPYSLNTFERHFVFADYDSSKRKPPPKNLDPRAHFALVCAAKGCPPLGRRCYLADSLDRQLDTATRQALASPAHLRWDRATGKLEVSSIFEWYKGDFGGLAGAFAFIKQYAPPTVRAEIEAANRQWWSWATKWDWDLNQAPDTGQTPDLPK